MGSEPEAAGAPRDAGTEALRIDYAEVMPVAREAMLGLQRAADSGGLEPRLVELVKIRASQLNGCAHCLDMHSKDARALGEDEQRLHLLAAWREAPVYSGRERAALAWCEALTLLPERDAPTGALADLTGSFSEVEIVALTLEVVAINGWNRLAVGFRSPVGGGGGGHARRPLPSSGTPPPRHLRAPGRAGSGRVDDAGQRSRSPAAALPAGGDAR